MEKSLQNIGIISGTTANMADSFHDNRNPSKSSYSGFDSVRVPTDSRLFTNLLTLYKKQMAEFKITWLIANLLGWPLYAFSIVENIENIKSVVLLVLGAIFIGVKIWQAYEKGRGTRIENDKKQYELNNQMGRNTTLPQAPISLNPWVIVAFVCLGLFLVVLFTGCSPLAPYKKVAADYPRSQEKRNILAPVCKIEFPVEKGKDSSSTTTTVIVKDTSANSALRAKIDQLGTALSQRPDCPQIDKDSLYEAIRSQIKPETHTITKIERIVETKIDSAGMIVLITQYNQLRQDYQKSVNEGVAKDDKIANLQSDVKDANKWKLYFGILAIVVGGYFILRVMKKVP